MKCTFFFFPGYLSLFPTFGEPKYLLKVFDVFKSVLLFISVLMHAVTRLYTQWYVSFHALIVFPFFGCPSVKCTDTSWRSEWDSNLERSARHIIESDALTNWVTILLIYYKLFVLCFIQRFYNTRGVICLMFSKEVFFFVSKQIIYLIKRWLRLLESEVRRLIPSATTRSSAQCIRHLTLSTL